MIDNVRGTWVHATPCGEDQSLPAEQRGTLRQRLDGLVNEVRETFVGSDGVTAAIQVKYFRTDYERVIATPEVRYPSGLHRVESGDFRRRKQDLHAKACKLLEELAIEAFDGESFPDRVAWPDRW